MAACISSPERRGAASRWRPDRSGIRKWQATWARGFVAGENEMKLCVEKALYLPVKSGADARRSAAARLLRLAPGAETRLREA